MRLPFLGKPESDGEKELIAYLNKAMDDALNNRRKHEREWLRNLMFFEGRQWGEAQYVNQRNIWVETNPDKVTYNQVMPMARQVTATLVENLSRTVAMPKNTDPDSRASSAIATIFLDHRYREDDEESVRTWEILNCLLFGRVVRKVEWDPDKEGVNANGERVKGLGDIKISTLTPDKFVMCPYDDTPYITTWIGEFQIVDVEDIKREFGVSVEPERVSTSPFGVSGDYESILGGVEPKPTPTSACMRRVIWLNKSAAYPNGRFVVWAGRHILHDGELPDSVWPFVCLDWMWTPKRVYPTPFMTPLVDPQRQYNRTISQVVEAKDRNMRNDIVITGGSGSEEDVTVTVNEDTGQRVIHVAPGVEKFQTMEYNWSASEANFVTQLSRQDLMHIAGVHEPSLGQAPDNVTTATQYMTQRESDHRHLFMFKRQMDKAYCLVDMLKIQLARKHYKAPRMIKAVGERNELKVLAFFGKDLDGVSNVEAISAPMVSETMRALMKREAAAQGLYGPYATPQDKLAKITALLNSGIPNVEEEVEQLLYPQTLDELKLLCGELDKLNAEVMIAQMTYNKMMLEAQMMVLQQQVGEAQQQQMAAAEQSQQQLSPEEQLLGQLQGTPPGAMYPG